MRNIAVKIRLERKNYTFFHKSALLAQLKQCNTWEDCNYYLTSHHVAHCSDPKAYINYCYTYI